MVGRRIERVELRREGLRFPFPSNMAVRMKGRTIERIDRRAKYMLARLDDGKTAAKQFRDADNMTEQLGALGVLGALAVHDVLELRMSCHAENDPTKCI